MENTGRVFQCNKTLTKDNKQFACFINGNHYNELHGNSRETTLRNEFLEPHVLSEWKEHFNLSSARAETKAVNDPVNRPSHYTDGKIEVIDYIEDKKLGYHLGNTVKYISRAGKKDPNKEIEDLKKARWYLDRRIETLKQIK